MNKNRLILIVDDNPQNLKVLGNALANKDYHLMFVNTGIKALEAVKNKKPDLILLDIMMPEMNGFEVCKQLKQELTTKEIPIIFLTAKVNKEDVIEGLKLGAVDYVTKPFNPQELLTRVNTHLELKTTKEELAQKVEELKQANATKDKFFSIIAHDLGNIFNGLLSFSSFLATQHHFLSTEEREEFIQDIQQSSIKGYNLLKNLLEWSILQTGRMPVKPSPINLQAVIDQNSVLLSRQAKAKNINIISDIDETTWILADQNMLDTVMRNLLSNAIKFTPTGGKIEISCQPAKNQHEVEFSISDTGVGISPQNMGKLFKMDDFHTTKGTNNEQGTGLGLILCQEFIEKNGGTIRVESEEGKGSRFYICLPLSEGEE